VDRRSGSRKAAGHRLVRRGDGPRHADRESGRRLVEHPASPGALVADGDRLRPPAVDAVVRHQPSSDLGVGPRAGVPGVEQVEPCGERTAGALEHRLLADPREELGVDGSRRGVAGRIGLADELGPGRGVGLAGACGARADALLERLLGGHRYLNPFGRRDTPGLTLRGAPRTKARRCRPEEAGSPLPREAGGVSAGIEVRRGRRRLHHTPAGQPDRPSTADDRCG
jgi:hypothetical protein